MPIKEALNKTQVSDLGPFGPLVCLGSIHFETYDRNVLLLKPGCIN